MERTTAQLSPSNFRRPRPEWCGNCRICNRNCYPSQKPWHNIVVQLSPWQWRNPLRSWLEHDGTRRRRSFGRPLQKQCRSALDHGRRVALCRCSRSHRRDRKHPYPHRRTATTFGRRCRLYHRLPDSAQGKNILNHLLYILYPLASEGTTQCSNTLDGTSLPLLEAELGSMSGSSNTVLGRGMVP